MQPAAEALAASSAGLVAPVQTTLTTNEELLRKEWVPSWFRNENTLNLPHPQLKEALIQIRCSQILARGETMSQRMLNTMLQANLGNQSFYKMKTHNVAGSEATETNATLKRKLGRPKGSKNKVPRKANKDTPISRTTEGIADVIFDGDLKYDEVEQADALHSAAKLCQLEESGVQHEASAAPSNLDKTSCRHCQRCFESSHGLKIHIGISKECNKVYAALGGTGEEDDAHEVRGMLEEKKAKGEAMIGCTVTAGRSPSMKARRRRCDFAAPAMAEKACTHTQPQIAADNEGWQSSNQPQRVLGHGSHESPTAQVASHLGGKTQQAEGRPTPRGQSDKAVVPFLKEPRTAEARANEQRMQAVIDGVTQEHGGCHAVIDGRRCDFVSMHKRHDIWVCTLCFQLLPKTTDGKPIPGFNGLDRDGVTQRFVVNCSDRACKQRQGKALKLSFGGPVDNKELQRRLTKMRQISVQMERKTGFSARPSSRAKVDCKNVLKQCLDDVKAKKRKISGKSGKFDQKRDGSHGGRTKVGAKGRSVLTTSSSASSRAAETASNDYSKPRLQLREPLTTKLPRKGVSDSAQLLTLQVAGRRGGSVRDDGPERFQQADEQRPHSLSHQTDTTEESLEGASSIIYDEDAQKNLPRVTEAADEDNGANVGMGSPAWSPIQAAVSPIPPAQDDAERAETTGCTDLGASDRAVGVSPSPSAHNDEWTWVKSDSQDKLADNERTTLVTSDCAWSQSRQGPKHSKQRTSVQQGEGPDHYTGTFAETTAGDLSADATLPI